MAVTVNCVTPAAVRTAIFDQMTQEHIDFMLGKIPMGRFGEVDEIAALVTWLASPECSFSTGAVFDASGGPREPIEPQARARHASLRNDVARPQLLRCRSTRAWPHAGETLHCVGAWAIYAVRRHPTSPPSLGTS